MHSERDERAAMRESVSDAVRAAARRTAAASRRLDDSARASGAVRYGELIVDDQLARTHRARGEARCSKLEQLLCTVTQSSGREEEEDEATLDCGWQVCFYLPLHFK